MKFHRRDLLGMALAGGASLVLPRKVAAQIPGATFNVVPLTISSVVANGGALFATGTLGGQSFTTPLLLSASPNQANPACPILDLELGPINLNLLGLNVDTSAICLRITAYQGGGLLGDLLCGIANLLNGGLTVSGLISQLTSGGGLANFLSALANVLNAGLARVTSNQTDVQVLGPTCNILNLSLGPVTLNLLGLEVILDDCEGGPVTVDITAEPGPGNLLGNLLCALANLLNGGAALAAVTALLRRIAREIARIIAAQPA